MDHHLLIAYLLGFSILNVLFVRLQVFRLPVLLVSSFLFLFLVWTLRPNHPHIAWIPIYIFLVSLHYLVSRYWVPRNFFWTWVGILLPILFLFGVRIFPVSSLSFLWEKIHWKPHGLDVFLGLSYMAFRLSFIAQEIKNRAVKKVTFLEYLTFAFFGPALLVGPITSGKELIDSMRIPLRVPFSHALLKILVGSTKYFFLSSILVRLTLAGLFNTAGRLHHPIDFFVGVVAAYPYLYCNFSGFCDIVIGIGQLLGIKISENFNNPFAARNVKDFWQRWHITLGDYLKNILFNPLSKTLSAWVGVNSAIVITVIVTFVFVGFWHGLEANYILFGVLNGVAVAINHVYTTLLKKFLDKETLKAYMKNRFIHSLSVVATYVYISITHVVFAYSLSQLSGYWARIVW